MVLEENVRVIEQATDERGLAVIHAPAREKPKQRLLFLRREEVRKMAARARQK
jgi:hypothetical protein